MCLFVCMCVSVCVSVSLSMNVMCEVFFISAVYELIDYWQRYRVKVNKLIILAISGCVDFITTKLAADSNIPNR